MKSYGIVLIMAVFSLFGCKKDAKQETLEEYMKRAGITTATKDSRGFYYQIVTQGAGTAPAISNKVNIWYKGMLTNGTVFDQTTTTSVTFPLNQLILGWQYGLPLIQPGGKIILYLPPSLGYGSQAIGGIPANSVLVFEIVLVSVS